MTARTALAFVLLCPLLVPAAEMPKGIAPDSVLERFTVPKGGDGLIVPVKVLGKERLFLVDTGCTHTVFDAALPLGPARRTMRGMTPTGEVEVKLYDAPPATLGKLRLKGVDQVVTTDLVRLREASGYEIEGVLGMDFLKHHVVHVDFDRGELLILKSVPAEAGRPLRFLPDRGGCPEVMAKLPDEGAVWLSVDTGFAGAAACALDAATVRELRRGDGLKRLGITASETFGGTIERAVYRAKRLNVAGFQVEGPVVTEGDRSNLLGLGFLARFAVTFDFPDSTLWLRKGGNFAKLARWNDAGLRLRRRDNKTLLCRVEPDGPAAKAGLKEGDELVKLADRDAAASTLFQLGEALRNGGAVKGAVRRDGKEIEFELELPREE
jgi:predicted aspartyl protease